MRVDGEIADAERGEVLEEVGTLGGIHMVVLQGRLDDDAGRTDMRPLHGDTQPVVTRAPASRSHEDVILVLSQEATVDLFYLVGDHRVIHGGEVITGLYIDHINDILRDTVAEGVVRTQQTAVIGYILDILVEHLLGVDDRTYLEEIERSSRLPRRCRLQIAGELYLYGAAHLLRAVSLYHLQQLRQREYALLEHTAEGYDLPAALVDSIADNLIHGVVGRGNIVQRPVGIGLFYTQFLDVEAVVHLEVVADMRHVQRIEACLRLTECRLHLRGL